MRCSGQLGVEEKEIEMEIMREIFSQEIFQVRTEGRVLQIYIQKRKTDRGKKNYSMTISNKWI